MNGYFYFSNLSYITCFLSLTIIDKFYFISVFTCVMFSCDCRQPHLYLTSPSQFTSALSWDKVFQESPLKLVSSFFNYRKYFFITTIWEYISITVFALEYPPLNYHICEVRALSVLTDYFIHVVQLVS